jgi:hypothetical protein
MTTANAARTRTAASRKKNAAKPPVVEAPFEPIELTTEDDTNPEVLVHLFSVNGTKYYVPGQQDMAKALQYLKKVESVGPDLAALWMLEQVLSPEGFAALMGMKGLKAASLAKLTAVIQSIMLGAEEVPKA